MKRARNFLQYSYKSDLEKNYNITSVFILERSQRKIFAAKKHTNEKNKKKYCNEPQANERTKNISISPKVIYVFRYSDNIKNCVLRM